MKNIGPERQLPLALTYLRYRRSIFCMLGVAVGIFAFVFYLNCIPAEIALYAGLLSLCAVFVYCAIDFVSYRRRHEELCRLYENAGLTQGKFLPPKSQLERDYNALVMRLSELLYEERKAAERGRRELTDYYTLWVHQIKTPISALRLLLAETHSEEGEAMLSELFKIEQYVEMVLGYLRVGELAHDLMLREYSLDEIVRGAIKKYSRLFVLGRLTLDFQPLGATVLTDERWLRFSIEQLLSNAIKYTPAGGCIRIYMKEDCLATLVLEDSGIGIREEDLPRIFERGYTGYNGRMDQRSSGIGLHLTARILAKLGHTITITSHVGEGTRCELDLAREHIEFE